MLGELIGEVHGKQVGARVVDEHGKVEVSTQESGKLLGMEAQNWTTFSVVARPDGTLWGEGQGAGTTRDGEPFTFRGQGVGVMTGRGMGATYRGAIYYQSPSPKLARLHKVAGVFEYDVDENGNTHAKIWEWK